MREFKFRGLTIGNEWVLGHFTHLKKDMNNIKNGYYISNSEGSPFAFSVRPETVGQYIGIKDKNNKPIYEGDLVKTQWQHCGVTNFDYEITGIIEYRQATCAFIIYDPENGKDYFIYSFCQEEFLEIEIIGNVYENPEL